MAQSSLRLGGYQGAGSILTQSLASLADELRRDAVQAQGRGVELDIDVTAHGESANALFASIENGKRHLGYMASGYLSARVPELGVLDLAFSVTDRARALAALDGEAGHLLSAAVARQSGYRVLGFWDNGFRHISNSVRPIRHCEDCRGLVIRTLDSAGYRNALAALGFNPCTTDVKELVRVVSTGEVQAQENPLTNLLTFALWRHHPHVSLTGHYFGVLLLVCHGDWYDALREDERQRLTRAAANVTRQQRELAAQADALALTALRRHGVMILEPHQIDLASMRKATQAVTLAACQGLPPALLKAYLPDSG
jgi:TRAP-type transport system periplasmic protein